MLHCLKISYPKGKEKIVRRSMDASLGGEKCDHN